MKMVQALTITTLFALSMPAFAKQVVCVFDPVGKAGDAYALAKDYALEAKNWGADIDLRAVTDERLAAEDLKVGKCDGAIISGLRGRQFNKYIGSLDAIGALTDMKTAISAYKLLSLPRAAEKMINGPYEIAGLGTIGPAYLFVNDKNINTLAKAAGKKLGCSVMTKRNQNWFNKWVHKLFQLMSPVQALNLTIMKLISFLHLLLHLNLLSSIRA